MWSGFIMPGGDGLDGDPLEMNWGVVPLPQGKQRAAVAFAQGYVVSAQAEAPDAFDGDAAAAAPMTNSTLSTSAPTILPTVISG